MKGRLFFLQFLLFVMVFSAQQIPLVPHAVWGNFVHLLYFFSPLDEAHGLRLIEPAVFMTGSSHVYTCIRQQCRKVICAKADFAGDLLQSVALFLYHVVSCFFSISRAR